MNFQFSLKDGHTPLELLFWTGGLIFLAVIDPIGSSLPELCLYKLVGFDSCPGCGLGQSISFLLHGEATNSFDAHVLGPVAFLLIINRIVMLTKNNLTIKRKEHSHA